MTDTLTFRLQVEPRAKARGRAVRTGRKCHQCGKQSGALTVFTPADTRAYESVIKMTCTGLMRRRGEKPIEGPIRAIIVAVWKRPQRMKKAHPGRHWRPSKPDCDNVAKAVLDALNGVAYEDDSQVVELTVQTIYAAAGEDPRLEIYVASALPLQPLSPPTNTQEPLL